MNNINVLLLGFVSNDNFGNSFNSIRMAGCEPTDVKSSNDVSKILEKESQFCHFVKPGTIIMPSFYEAALNMCGKFDYTFCHCSDLDKKEICDSPSPKNFIIGQILVKTWVVKELGINGDNFESLLGRVLTEYRGVEIPHIMAMKIIK